MRKLLHGSGITGRERGSVVAYSGELQEGKWTSLVDGSNPTHTGVQRQVPRVIPFDKATHFPVDVVGGTRNYLTIPKKFDYRLGGTVILYLRSLAVGGANNRGILFAYGGAGPYTYYYLYLGPANILNARFGLGSVPASTGYTLPLYKWVRVALTWSTSTVRVYIDGNQVYTASGFTLPDDIIAGSNLVASADGVGNLAEWQVADFVQANTAWTADEVKRDWLLYASRTLWEEDFGNVNVSPVAEGGTIGAHLSNSQFRFSEVGGRWKIADAIINGKARKAIECTTAGSLYVPAQYLGFEAASPELAYGTPSFYFKKAAATNPKIHFIASASLIGSTSGYALEAAADETLYLRRYTVGAVAATPFTSAVGAISESIWTKFAISRRYDGRFSIYKDGVLLPAAAGANPCTDTTHTTGSYVLLDMGVGDFIGGLSKTFGEIT